jgi:ribosomal protein L36
MKEEYVNCLLDYGANPKAKSKKRETPLKLVKKKGKLYMILKKKHKKKRPLSVK